MGSQVSPEVDFNAEEARLMKEILALEARISKEGGAQERDTLISLFDIKERTLSSLRSREGKDEQVAAVPKSTEVGFQYFASRLLEIAQEMTDSDVYDFKKYWWDSKETACQKLYVRGCYKTLLSNCLDHRRSVPNGIFLLSGTPGTGKSGFGLYAVIQLVRQKQLVWYKHKGDVTMIFTGGREGLESLKKVWPKKSFVIGQVYAMKGEEEDRLKDVDGIIRVHDPVSDKSVDLSGSFFEIIVSSPDELKLKDVENSPVCITFYSPLWTQEELTKIADFHGLSGHEMSVTRYRWCGGVPRLLAKPDYEGFIRGKCGKATLTGLQGFFSSDRKGSLPTQVIHMVASGDMKSQEYKLGSEEITKILIQKTDHFNELDIAWFVRGCKGEPFVQVLRGKVMERRWHELLSEGGKFSGLHLGTTTKNSKSRMVSISLAVLIPLTKREIFRFDSLDELNSISTKFYYLPLKRNQAMFDSFALVSNNKVFSSPGSKTSVLVAFQMTVGTRHGISTVGYDELHELASRFKSQIDRIVVVFVSEVGGLNMVQSVNVSKSKVADASHDAWKCQQYVIHLDWLTPDLEQLYPKAVHPHESNGAGEEEDEHELSSSAKIEKSPEKKVRRIVDEEEEK